MPNHGDPLTVEELARSIKPKWNFPGDWFYWPPDVFAFTSTVFRETGCYTHVLSEVTEPSPEPPNDGNSSLVDLREWHGSPLWQNEVEKDAARWLSEINTILQGNASNRDCCGAIANTTKLKAAVATIKEQAPCVTLRNLRLLKSWLEGDPPNNDDLNRTKALCEALIVVHAVSDAACSGFGLPNAPNPDHAMAQYLGNLLLTTRGSLSSVRKLHGIVLPKMHTPRAGLTLRSMSHHLAFHRSEVEVMWRATPWVNVQENMLNILCLPWPFKVADRCFNDVQETFESVRYFSYAPPKCNQDHINKFTELVCRVSKKVSRLHLLMFPETAVAKADYKDLLWSLRAAHMRGNLRHIPMVVAGVHNKVEKRRTNEVRLAAYFAGRWYELSQRKHHKWKLDHNQIRQYNLQGRLSTRRPRYENTTIAQRRLTFLAPNGWLTLCPLICEDLAQLEPVSELIRGVGPTLLLTPLLDGPQLRERWPARYASVFADDPGTAVLTLTSLGMATRSHRLQGGEPNEEPSRAVGLWRDLIRGWEMLDLGKEKDAYLLTISADWTEEYTADGRTDYGSSAVFKLEGTQQFSLPSKPRDYLSMYRRSREDERRAWLQHWEDIRALTVATYTLDTVIELQGKYLETILDLLQNRDLESKFTGKPRQIHELVNLLSKAWVPARSGAAVGATEPWPTMSTKSFAAELDKLKDVLCDTDQKDYWGYLEHLTNHAITTLDTSSWPTEIVDDEAEWIKISVAIATLAAVHYRIARFRRKQSRQYVDTETRTAARRPRTSPTFLSNSANLLNRIEEHLVNYA